MPRRPKKLKTVQFESDIDFDKEKPKQIFTDVEREIIRADMAYLIQKEKDNGDWAKWEESQRPFIMHRDLTSELHRYEGRGLRRARINDGHPITIERFTAAVGRPPQLDELDRAQCAASGTIGHWQCGWCDICDKPRFVCHHLNRG
jgi:hypothetical protein